MKLDILTICATMLMLFLFISIIVTGQDATQCQQNPFKYVANKVSNEKNISCVCITESKVLSWDKDSVSKRVGYLS